MPRESHSQVWVVWCRVARLYKKARGEKLGKSGLKAAMQEMDVDGNGYVELPEFEAWWSRHGGDLETHRDRAFTLVFEGGLELLLVAPNAEAKEAWVAACNAMLTSGTGSPAEDKPKAPPAASDEDTESEDGDDADPLPDGWEAVVSRSTGQTYYHHIESGETTYDYPTAPKQLAAVYASHPLFCCS